MSHCRFWPAGVSCKLRKNDISHTLYGKHTQCVGAHCVWEHTLCMERRNTHCGLSLFIVVYLTHCVHTHDSGVSCLSHRVCVVSLLDGLSLNTPLPQNLPQPTPSPPPVPKTNLPFPVWCCCVCVWTHSNKLRSLVPSRVKTRRTCDELG